MGGDPLSDLSGLSSLTSKVSESNFSSDDVLQHEQQSSSRSEEDGYLITANCSLHRQRLQEENRAHQPKRKMILKLVAPANYMARRTHVSS